MTALTSTGMTTWVPQAEHDQALADLAATRAHLTAAVEALRLTAGPGCSAGDWACRTVDQQRNQRHDWCAACVAADALDSIPDQA